MYGSIRHLKNCMQEHCVVILCCRYFAITLLFTHFAWV